MTTFPDVFLQQQENTATIKAGPFVEPEIHQNREVEEEHVEEKEKEQGKKRIKKEDVQRKSVEDVVNLINILKSFKHN